MTQPGRITESRDLWPIADRPAGAFRSELPIAWDREFTSHDYRNNGPATTGKRSPLGQVRALPAGEAGPSAWSARANTNAQSRFLCWRRPALATSPKTQACIVCSELAATVSIRACRTRHAPPTPPLAALAGMPFTNLSAIYRTSGSHDPPAGDGPAEDSRSGTGRRRGPGGAAPESPRPVTWSPRRESAAAAQARLAGAGGF